MICLADHFEEVNGTLFPSTDIIIPLVDTFQCGHGDRKDYVSPKMIVFDKPVIQIACGPKHSAAVTGMFSISSHYLQTVDNFILGTLDTCIILLGEVAIRLN